MDRRPETKAEATRRSLAERFPNCFIPKKAEKKPLAIGVIRQVFAAAPDLSRRSIRLAMHDYTNGLKYWRNLSEGATRINLDGSPAGVVSGDHAEHAGRTIIGPQKRWKRERFKNKPRPQQVKLDVAA
jgi:sRNA-binding protein